jgi:SAM-dependent methyltransferase
MTVTYDGAKSGDEVAAVAGTAGGSGISDAHVSGAAARSWIERWDSQQQIYMPDREDRFTALIDAVEAGTGRKDPLVLDLGCGPGSLAVRLLDRLPEATVVAIDADPVLLALGRAAHGDRAGLRFADADLRTPGWPAALGLDRQPDAAVSTTALHWLLPDALASLYAELAQILASGGLLLNGDHMTEEPETAPVLVRLGKALIEREEERRGAARSEDWAQWWAAALADPALAGLAAQRDNLAIGAGHHGSPSGRLSTHLSALHAAGFAEIGTLWQRGDNRLLCAVVPG